MYATVITNRCFLSPRSGFVQCGDFGVDIIRDIVFPTKGEMDIHILLLFFLLFVIDTNSSHLTAIRKPESSNLQKSFTERDLERCVRWPYGLSMRMTTFSIVKCMQTYISHCVKTPVIKEQQEYASYEEYRYCGMISLRRDQVNLPGFIHVATLNEFAIELDILLFDFTWTRYGCASHGLSILDDATDKSEWFCGKRLPWIIMRFKSNNDYIELNITPYQHFQVRLFYSSQSLTWLKHLIHHHYIHLPHTPVAIAASTGEAIEKYNYYAIANHFQVLVFSHIKVTSSNFMMVQVFYHNN